MRTRLADVERWVEVYRHTHFREFDRQSFRVDARRFYRAGRGHPVKPVKHFARRIGCPLWRLHPLDPAAFLVDRDEQPLSPMDGAQIVG